MLFPRGVDVHSDDDVAAAAAAAAAAWEPGVKQQGLCASRNAVRPIKPAIATVASLDALCMEGWMCAWA